ncbi:hypothetical protein MMC30_000006 [Trapelia coarctata]|nr:hypothetical protein [Trapelia coarctata]
MEPPLKRQRIAQSQEQLHEQRARNDLRLKSRFEHIFEKFSKDFTGVGDEIEMSTGKVIVNNGHLLTMQNERDIEGLANDEDELAAETVGSSREPEAGKSKILGDLQDNLVSAAEAVIALPLPLEVPCVGLNIASAIKMDDGATYDNSVHGDLFINRTILDQLSRLGPHIRKSIANVKRSAATSLVVSIETEDLTVDPKWRLPVILQQKPDEEVDKVVEASEAVEADPMIPECDPERSPSPEGVSLWALDSMLLSRKVPRRKDAAMNAPRPRDQVLKISRLRGPKPKDHKLQYPKPKDPKLKDPKLIDPKPADLQPKVPRHGDPKPKNPQSKKPTPKISKPDHRSPKDTELEDSERVDRAQKDRGSKDEVHTLSWAADEEEMLRNPRTKYGLALDQIRIPDRSPRFITQRWNFMRLDEVNGMPLSIPSTDSPAGKESAVAISSPSVQKQNSSSDTSKNAPSSHTSRLINEGLFEDATISPRNRKRGDYKKTRERKGISDNHDAEPVDPPASAIDGESDDIPDSLAIDAPIAPRNRKRGFYKKTGERLSKPDSHAAEQAESTGLAFAGGSSVVAESQAPVPDEYGNPRLKITSQSLAPKSRKRGRPSLAESLEDAHESLTSRKNDTAITGQPTSKKTLSPEIPQHGVKELRPRERKATARLTVPERPRTVSETPEILRNDDPAPAALEKETVRIVQPRSLRMTRAQAQSKVAGLTTPVHDKKQLSETASKTHGMSSSPPPSVTKAPSQKAVISATTRSKDLTPRSLVAPSTPDGIALSVELSSAVGTREPVRDGSSTRRRAMRSISSSPDPVADGSGKTIYTVASSPSKRSSRKATAQRQLRKHTPKKRLAKSASSAPRISLSSILGDASDDELSNIKSKDQVLNSTKSPGSAIKSRLCGSPRYNCKRSLCLTCS